MFSKVLIANRGEIACRIIRTARRMGIGTVAVYSDADRDAMHVAQADQAVHIGPAPVAESYLQADRIIEAALATGTEAIHPGYGFLSENADFAGAVSQAGLAFVGPSADAIRAMGLKDAAKALMEKAGVPVVPGYHGEDQDPDTLAACAKDIGYPVLIKARAGGGGKGMRLVDAPGAFGSALEGAKREALASFGDDVVLIEKFIQSPRHVEIQVFGDTHGNIVHLFERDCSLQRRHQKVIEEAPAPGMTPQVRAAMGAAAVSAAKAIGYSGAGTVEFIVDGSDGLRPDRFWFMEMNTRLQVEHPVTEAITGLDLVEQQLRVAYGLPLGFTQDDLAIDGHAFEARIYAEDVDAGFLPATGTLDHLSFPDDARVDTGVRRGDVISPYYDPMIAKVVVHGEDRAHALTKLRKALEGTHVAGSTTNLAFLHALACHDGFAKGEVDTGLIERDLARLTARPPVPPAIVVVAALKTSAIERSPFVGFRHWSEARIYFDLLCAGEEFRGCLIHKGRDLYGYNDRDYSVHFDGDRVRISEDGSVTSMTAILIGERACVFSDGRSYVFDPVPLGLSTDDAGAGAIVAPMPGLLKVVDVAQGDRVAKDQPLLVLEAMKMEHTLTAPRDGTVASVLAAVGDQVEADALLIRLEEEHD